MYGKFNEARARVQAEEAVLATLLVAGAVLNLTIRMMILDALVVLAFYVLAEMLARRQGRPSHIYAVYFVVVAILCLPGINYFLGLQSPVSQVIPLLAGVACGEVVLYRKHRAGEVK